jgi:Na+/H+-dicarboxylate symporter
VRHLFDRDSASFSVPGVPHGWLLVVSPLLVTMGIPAEGIGFLMAVDAIPDSSQPRCNVTGDMVVAAIVSRNQQGQSGSALQSVVL